MTQEEYKNLKPGDVIFDLEENKGYHLTEIKDDYVRYEDNRGQGSIPSSHILKWNYVSLMRNGGFGDFNQLLGEKIREIQSLLIRGGARFSVLINKDFYRIEERD